MNKILSCSVKYLLTLLCIIFVGSTLLFISGLLPQDKIEANLTISFEEFATEGDMPGVLLGYYEYDNILDNYNDALILAQSNYMNTRMSEKSIYTNPVFSIYGHDKLEYAQTIYDGNDAINYFYYRYWMGFRIYARLFLCFMSIFQIRKVLSFIFYILFTLTVVSIYKNTKSVWYTLAFCFTMLTMNPLAVSISLQFLPCFAIAMISMIILPLILKSNKTTLCMYFYILGILCMFFDFYTAPLITFGLPFTYYLVLNQRVSPAANYFTLLKTFGAWFIGYLFMWLSKLLLVDIFTDFNAFLETFSVTAVRLGTGGIKAADTTGIYSSINALTLCLKNLFSPFLNFLAICAVLLWIYKMIKNKKLCAKTFTDNFIYIAIMIIPVVWISISAQPSSIHHFFQYRTLGVLVFAFSCWLINTAAHTE